MDQWFLAVTSGLDVKRSAKDLEVVGADHDHCHFPFPPVSLSCVVPNVVFQYVELISFTNFCMVLVLQVEH